MHCVYNGIYSDSKDNQSLNVMQLSQMALTDRVEIASACASHSPKFELSNH